jgi:hypothetical protein
MSAIARNQVFSAVHTVGGLLPADMLVRISEGKDVSGCKPADYRVAGSRSVRDEAERHWDYLRSLWTELRQQLPPAPEADTPADPTRLATAQWLAPLFDTLGFGVLTSIGASGITSDDGTKTFAISHRWNHVPVHLIAWNADLDKRPGGAGTVPPQSLVQECLNRTAGHLWAVVTNGRHLRLLRDSSALATASYVEFDLEAIFDGELFSEFVLLYRLLHVSRFAVAEGAAPSACWLERWRTEAITSGTRALEQLRDGVQKAITMLGTGFLRHPDNAALRANVDVAALHQALLRLVYRILFVFVAEDRDALHHPDADTEARARYATYFSTARMRAHARRRRGTSHSDLYQALRIVLDALGDERGRPELGLPGLGGIFDPIPADEPLSGLELPNQYLLAAVRHLSQVYDPGAKRWRAVDYQHLDAEELGSIYESLLELIPRHSAVDLEFELVTAAGNARKTTGSYYTPSSLIELLLDSALDPVIEDAFKRGEQKATVAGLPDPAESIAGELLSLTVCDPACGSGHFLVAAARRIAKRVAAVREGNPEPTVPAVRSALHEVIARCIYGVDLNPMAVELAKVSLWLEALEPGKPLSFLDAHIKCGNALIGATPRLLKDGIPDAAFKPIEGDDPGFARVLAAQSRSGTISLFDVGDHDEIKVANTGFASELRTITAASADTLAGVRAQAARYADWESSPEYRLAQKAADAWCAAFLWRKTTDAPKAITQDVYLSLQYPRADTPVPQETHDEIALLREDYGFLHWHLAFPDVFEVPDSGVGVNPETGWAGGFSCVLGNPPWDRLEFEDKKYFSVVEPSIAQASGAAMSRRITAWMKENPAFAERYLAERRKLKATSHFAAASQKYPFCAEGLTVKGVTKLQVDQLFVELFSSIAAGNGRSGCIAPTALATSAGAQHLFANLTGRGAISSLYDFENATPLFPGVHRSYKFCILSLVGRSARELAADFAFFLHDPAELGDADNSSFRLTPDEITLLNPNTRTLPMFRSRKDADLTLSVYRRFDVLSGDNVSVTDWRVRFKYIFRSANDGDVFRTHEELIREGWDVKGNTFIRSGERMLPLYEAKMTHYFDHRWALYYDMGDEDRRVLTPAEKQDPSATAQPRYWIAEADIAAIRRNAEVRVPGVGSRLAGVGWDRDWLCGWRDVARATDERTAIPAFIPRTATLHTLPLMFPDATPEQTAALVATQSSLVFDYVSRQKIGGIHMSLMIWKQLPVPGPKSLEPHTSFLTPRVLELAYTAYDMAGLARDLGDSAGPFRWYEDRRIQIRAELDSYFFHLYGISRDDTEYILETFQSESGGGLKNNEIAKYGSYRTKDLVLAEYDRMATAGVSLHTPLVDGENYTSTLTPSPGHGPRHRAATV